MSAQRLVRQIGDEPEQGLVLGPLASAKKKLPHVHVDRFAARGGIWLVVDHHIMAVGLAYKAPAVAVGASIQVARQECHREDFRRFGTGLSPAHKRRRGGMIR